MAEPEEINEQLTEALGKLRIDEYHPWRYIFFVFLAGIARGIGLALGMTLVLAIVVYLLSKLLSNLVDLPLIGAYFKEIADLIQTYLKTGVK